MGWAFNVWAFGTWLFTLLFGSIGLLLTLSKAGPGPAIGNEKEAFGVSSTISAISDFAMAFFAAAVGHWFYAFLVVIQQLLEQLVRSQIKEKPTETPVAS